MTFNPLFFKKSLTKTQLIFSSLVATVLASSGLFAMVHANRAIEADLLVTQPKKPSIVQIGDMIEYQLAIESKEGLSKNIHLVGDLLYSDPSTALPPLKLLTTQGSCQISTSPLGHYECELGDLEAGEIILLTVTTDAVKTASGPPEVIANTAYVHSDAIDLDMSNNQSYRQTHVYFE